MKRLGAIALLLIATPAAADPDVPDRAAHRWRLDFGMDVVVPLTTQAYEDSTSFGGRVLARATRGPLSTQLSFDLLSRDNGPAMEQVGYRTRALAGARWRREPSFTRAVELRAMAGVELVGMDRIASDWPAERYAPGVAAEVAIENRNDLGWGTVALQLGLGLSAVPFGSDEETTYVGLDVLFGFTLSF